MKNDSLYCYVGNWGFKPGPRGISIFEYHTEDGSLRLLDTIREDISAGQLCLDAERDILYSNDECGERRGEIGGGGYVYAFRINRSNGTLSLISQVDSLSPEPSYLCLTKDKKFLIVCHCADPWHVTKIVKRADGTWGNEVLFDDTALVLFPVHEDGTLGDACDVMITQGSGGKSPRASQNVDPVSHHIQLVEVISRLHSIFMNPEGSLFVTLDKGMDKIITFRVDEEKRKLIKLDEYTVGEVASFPRYGVFHPVLPLFYANNENRTLLNCFSYTPEGKIRLRWQLKVVYTEPRLVHGKPAGCQDIIMDGEGKHLYISISGLNEVSVVRLDEQGTPELIQEISTAGNFPRALQISPDGRFLLAGNMVSGDITVFHIQEDGTLKATGKIYQAVSPSAIRFLT